VPDVLSQNEVDALLAAVSSTGGAKRPAGGDVKYYDFLRPERASSSTMRGLADVHESAARAIADALSGALRLGVDCRLRALDQVAWGEFIVGLPNPTCFAVVEAKGAGGRFAVEVGPGVVFPMIERLLGAADDAEPEVPERAMTDIERRVASTVVGIVSGALAGAWRGCPGAPPVVVQIESNSGIVQIAPPAEMAALATFEIALGARSGLAHVAMPFGAWGGFLAELAAASERVETATVDASADAAAVRGALARVPVRVEAVAVTMRMKLRDIAGLSVDSVLETPRRASDDIVVAVEGRPKFRATQGTLRGRRAFRVGRPAPEPAAAPRSPEAAGTTSEGES
jgi:flagellar motor switch protein FliM